MRDVELEEIKGYWRCRYNVPIKRTIYRWVRQNRNHKAFDEIEIPLVKVLADMEKEEFD
jgi:DNA polymerase I-like protein with 3'-5' exonuclease and polymerase domains